MENRRWGPKNGIEKKKLDFHITKYYNSIVIYNPYFGIRLIDLKILRFGLAEQIKQFKISL